MVISGDLELWLFSVVATSKVYLSTKKCNAKKKKKQILALYPNRKKGILSEPQGGCYGSVFSAEKQKVCLMICFP